MTTDRAAPQSEDPSRRWDVRHNRAVRELLDHVARELAEEYVRLTKQAATSKEEQR
jgi:hypothetical protein